LRAALERLTELCLGSISRWRERSGRLKVARRSWSVRGREGYLTESKCTWAGLQSRGSGSVDVEALELSGLKRASEEGRVAVWTGEAC
jgi:hypothetical protein